MKPLSANERLATLIVNHAMAHKIDPVESHAIIAQQHPDLVNEARSEAAFKQAAYIQTQRRKQEIEAEIGTVVGRIHHLSEEQGKHAQDLANTFHRGDFTAGWRQAQTTPEGRQRVEEMNRLGTRRKELVAQRDSVGVSLTNAGVDITKPDERAIAARRKADDLGFDTNETVQAYSPFGMDRMSGAEVKEAIEAAESRGDTGPFIELFLAHVLRELKTRQPAGAWAMFDSAFQEIQTKKQELFKRACGVTEKR